MNDTAERPSTHTPAGPPPTERGEAAALARHVLRSWWIILLCAVIAVAIGVGVQGRQKRSYSATSYVLLSTSNFQQVIAGGYTSINPLTQQATAIGYLTPARKLDAARAAGLRVGSSYSISITPKTNSNVLPVQANASTAQGAAKLADAAANQMIAVLRASNVSQLRQARAILRVQQRNAPTKNFKRTLTGNLNSLATLEALSDHSIQVIQNARVPSRSAGISRLRIGAIALVLGLLVGIAIAVVRPRTRA